MSWQNFVGQQFEFRPPQPSKKAYSVTADVLAFRTCSIQYGAFRARRYEPATVPQLFWGTAIHQVLDMAHAHYRGLIGPMTPGAIPSDAEIDNYFAQVERALRARQISVMDNIRDQARELVQRFNRLEGPQLYPKVLDTECRLESDQGDYILQGTVDVIRLDDNEPPAVEIWDYKGTSNPGMGSPQYALYEYQMQVYAELYRRRFGTVPASVALYFVNELSGDPQPTVRPANAVMRIQLDHNAVRLAIADFSQAVTDIQRHSTNKRWPAPDTAPDKKTCNGCDLRWNCQTMATTHGRVSLLFP